MPDSGAAGRSDAVDDLIRQMYEAAPDGFVAARTAAVAAARKAGDRDTAKRLASLRKPTVAAWLVNLLAVRRPDLLDELVELAAELRAAQRGLHGDQLRELSTQRRRAVSALVAEARRLAVEADSSLGAGKLPLAEVETTLTAALADVDIAEQVRSGQLIRAASYAGFGEVPRPRLRLVTDVGDGSTDVPSDVPSGGDPAPAAREPAGTDRSGRGDRAADDAQAASQRRAAQRRAAERRRELERELSTARTAEIRARRHLDRAEAAERDAGHVVVELEAELADLERRRTAAHQDVADRKLARRAAQRDAAVTRRRVGDVEAALEALDDDSFD